MAPLLSLLSKNATRYSCIFPSAQKEFNCKKESECGAGGSLEAMEPALLARRVGKLPISNPCITQTKYNPTEKTNMEREREKKDIV